MVINMRHVVEAYRKTYQEEGNWMYVYVYVNGRSIILSGKTLEGRRFLSEMYNESLYNIAQGCSVRIEDSIIGADIVIQ